MGNCGKNKVWLDPNETNEISLANSRKDVRRLIKDGFVIRKVPVVHSRFRARRRALAKRKGRHTGIGKRKGTREARLSAEETKPKKGGKAAKGGKPSGGKAAK